MHELASGEANCFLNWLISLWEPSCPCKAVGLVCLVANNGSREVSPSGFYKAFPAERLVRTEGGCSKGRPCAEEGDGRGGLGGLQPVCPALRSHRPPPARFRSWGPLKTPLLRPAPTTPSRCLPSPPQHLLGGGLWLPKTLRKVRDTGCPPTCHQVAPLARDNPRLSLVAGWGQEGYD